jgi:hypothetical protein
MTLDVPLNRKSVQIALHDLMLEELARRLRIIRAGQKLVPRVAHLHT